LKQEHNQFIMANGYVPRFMQPPPGIPHPLQRLPLPVADPNRPNAAPDALFEPSKPAFCPFPDDGPNIFQQAFSSVSKVVVGSLMYFGSIPGAFVHAMGNIDRDMLTIALRENSWSIIIGLVCVVVLGVLAWFFSPKGENQTYVHPLVFLWQSLHSSKTSFCD
jgi:hypothetical protein